MYFFSSFLILLFQVCTHGKRREVDGMGPRGKEVLAIFPSSHHYLTMSTHGLSTISPNSYVRNALCPEDNGWQYSEDRSWYEPFRGGKILWISSDLLCWPFIAPTSLNLLQLLYLILIILSPALQERPDKRARRWDDQVHMCLTVFIVLVKFLR